MSTPPKLHPVAYYLDFRLYEWVMSVGKTMTSLCLLVWPEMGTTPALSWMNAYIGSRFVSVIFLVVGVLQVMALLANGGSDVVGPRVRATCALISALFWAQITISLIAVSISQGFPSLGVSFWFLFTLAELYVAYRSTLDVRTASQTSS